MKLTNARNSEDPLACQISGPTGPTGTCFCTNTLAQRPYIAGNETRKSRDRKPLGDKGS